MCVWGGGGGGGNSTAYSTNYLNQQEYNIQAAQYDYLPIMGNPPVNGGFFKVKTVFGEYSL